MESNVPSFGKAQHYLFSNILLTLQHRQDLNCSVMTGSDRLFNHTTFAELHWRRDPFSPGFYTLLPGFKRLSDLLTEDFIEILEDLNALSRTRDSPSFISVCGDATGLIQIDNHQASLQSRLLSLPNTPIFRECCHLAAYLSACQLCCKVWRSSVIPVSILHRLHSRSCHLPCHSFIP